MTSAVQGSTSADYTEVPFVVRSGVILGVLQSVLVFAFSFASRLLESGLQEGHLGGHQVSVAKRI